MSVKVFGEDANLVTSLGSITQGIGKEFIPIEGTIPTLGSDVQLVYTPVLLGSSFVNQSPVALDTPLQVNFGAASSNAFIDLDAAGNITFLQVGVYEVSIRVALGRTTNPGAAILLARATLNGSQIGNSFHANLPDQDTNIPLSVQTNITASVNDVFAVQIMRSSAGVNAGGLFTQAGTAGWNNSPSAQATVTRVTGVVV